MRRLAILSALVVAQCTDTPEASVESAPTPVPEPVVVASPGFALLPSITAPAFDTAVTEPTETDWLTPVGACPEGWPERVQIVLDSAGARPAEIGCRGMVADFNGDGLPDMALSVDTPAGGGYVAVLDGDDPRLEHVTERGQNHRLFAISPGNHFLAGCSDNPDDWYLNVPNPGFLIINQISFARYYYYVNGELTYKEAARC